MKYLFTKEQVRKFLIIGMFLLLVLCGLIYLFSHYRLTKENDITQLLSNLIQFSGIFSAIIITFLVSKVFQIRQEKNEIKKQLIKLSNKILDFRRIARILVDCYGFWNQSMRQKIDTQYEDLDFFIIENQNLNKKDPRQELLSEFFKEREIPGWCLYLDMKSLVLQSSEQFGLYDKYDYDYCYPLEILEKWTDAHSGGNLWYCLSDKSHKWNDYKNCFNFTAIAPHDKQEIIALAVKIDARKFRGREFDKELLGDIGSDFEGFYFPKARDLSYYNSLGLPKSLKFLLGILIVTIISGLIVPLILTSINFSFGIKEFISYSSISILILVLVYLIIKFKSILEKEIKL